MFLTVHGVHHGVYRQRPAIQQLQRDVCLQLQFRSPLVEAIGKRANIPLPFPGRVSLGPLTDAPPPPYVLRLCSGMNYTSDTDYSSEKMIEQNFKVAAIDFTLLIFYRRSADCFI